MPDQLAIILELKTGEMQFAEYPEADESTHDAAYSQMKKLREIGELPTCEVVRARLIKFEVLQQEVLLKDIFDS